LEDLRDAWARSSDPVQQKKIADELQIRSFEVVPYVNYGQWFAPTAYRNNLKGVIISPVPFFWNISKG
ncbi:MAG: ABC transporter substrate-binding protein, partial [SAR324 cluster bacterium]|nr:ABC transporter substrate-binding protein [SAR324 cluster bacterium]